MGSESAVAATVKAEPDASQTDEYASGRIICETCGDAIPIRDEASGAFTVKHWDAHRGAWCVCMRTRPARPRSRRR